MNRLAGIIVAVVGILVVILSVLNVAKGLTSTGGALVLLGLLVIGLSFIKKPNTEDTPKMSTPETLGGIFYEPAEVFHNLRRHPRWFAALLIISIFSAVFYNLFLYRLTPERVTNFTIDKTLEISFIASNPDAIKGVEAGRAQALEENRNPVLRAGQAIRSFVGLTYLVAFLAAVYLLFALAMGGQINYWQAFSVAVYSMFPIAAIRFVLNTIILFVKDPIEIHPTSGQNTLIQDNLGFFVTASEHPALFVLLSSFGVITLYGLWLNATGLKNVGERISSGIAWTASLSILVLVTLLGIIAALAFPNFIG
jgi:hypothetical protein